MDFNDELEIKLQYLSLKYFYDLLENDWQYCDDEEDQKKLGEYIDKISDLIGEMERKYDMDRIMSSLLDSLDRIIKKGIS